jgi:hypothetical protein
MPPELGGGAVITLHLRHDQSRGATLIELLRTVLRNTLERCREFRLPEYPPRLHRAEITLEVGPP